MKLSGNAVLASTYADLSTKIERARRLANLDRTRWGESMHEHRAVVDSLRARDKTELVARLTEHNSRTAQAVLAKLQA